MSENPLITEYVNFIRQWKNDYKELTNKIREIKKTRKFKDNPLYDPFYTGKKSALREKARNMMLERTVKKIHFKKELEE